VHEVDGLLTLITADKLDIRAMIPLIEGARVNDAASDMIRAALADRFAALEEPPDSLGGDGLRAWKRGRGYRLEELLTALCALEGLRPAPSYRGRGEQVDGLFELGGLYALMEVKWHAGELPASEVYGFLGKVDGKLAGTLGVFVSMGGFAKDAAVALSIGKLIRVILVDGDDVRAVFDGSERVTWRELVDLKVRRAAQYGDLYFTWKQHQDMRDAK